MEQQLQGQVALDKDQPAWGVIPIRVAHTSRRHNRVTEILNGLEDRQWVGGGGHNKGLYPGTGTLALTLIPYASGQPLLFKGGSPVPAACWTLERQVDLASCSLATPISS